MGELNAHNLSSLIGDYGLKSFVETGTGIGTGLSYAAGFPFSRLISIEVVPELYEKAKDRFAPDQRITILNGTSRDGLFASVTSLINPDDPCLFWLDAHFPGADFGLGSYKDEHEPWIKYPLEVELEVIASFRNCRRDVLIIDDLRLYEPGQYELGDWPEKVPGGLWFVSALFGHTHILSRDYRQQGFLVVKPLAKG